MSMVPDVLAAAGSWLSLRLAELLGIALDLSIKGSVVLLAAAGAAVLLRRRSAAVRHALWSGAVAAVLALPLLELALPAWRVPLLPAASSTVAVQAEVVPDAGPDEVLVVPPGTAPAAEPAVAPVAAEILRLDYAPAAAREGLMLAALSWSEWAGILWATGALLVLLRIAAGTLGVWIISRRAAPVLDGDWLALAVALARRLGVSRPVTLLRSDRASVPVTWGVVYPVVLLPRETRGWPHDRREAVLLHELAHVRRFDALTQTIGQLALAVHWFNPLVWLAVRRMRAERERACDDAVLLAGARPSSYAEDLLDIVRSLHREPGPAFAALAMARRSELEGRLLAILDPRTSRGALGRGAAALVAALAMLLVLPVAAMRPVAAEARAPEGVAAPDAVAAVEAAPADAPLGVTPRATPREPAPRRVSSVALPCSMSTLIRDDEPYSVARAERMYFNGTDDRCMGATYRGRLQLSDDREDVRSLAPDGFLVIVEQRGSARQRVEFVPGPSGDVRRLYYSGTRRAPLDGAARRWVARMLVELAGTSAVPSEWPGFAPAAVAAERPDARAAAPAPETAAPPVLSRMTRDEVLETLILAARSAGNLTSDAEKARLLGEIATRWVRDDTLRAAYLRATRSIVSDGSKSAALQALVRRDTLDPRGFVSVVRVAREVVSDGDRARILKALAARHTLADSAMVRAYFAAANEIVAESDRRAVLLAALPAGASRDLALGVLKSAAGMVSGRDRGDVLLAVVERASLADPAVRRAFFAALEGMQSDADYRRVMAAVMR